MKCFAAILFSSALLASLSSALLFLLFPAELHARRIAPSIGSLVLALTFLPYTLTPLWLSSSLLAKIGRSNAYACACVLLGFSSITFAYLHYVPSPDAFLWIILMTLIVHGVGNSLLQTSTLAILSSTFSRSVGKVSIAFMAFQNLGGACGVSLGFFIFYSHSFLLPVILIGISLLLLSFSKFYFPPSPALPLPYRRVVNAREENIKMRDVMSSCRALLAYICLFAMILSASFFHLPLFHNLLYRLALAKTEATLLYLAFSCASTIVSFFLLLTPENTTRMKISFPATLISGIGLMLIGPSRLFVLPNSPSIILTGLILTGGASTIPAALTFSQVILATRTRFARNYERLVDVSACLFTFWKGAGLVTAPLIGSFFESLGGFRRSCEAVSAIVILFAWFLACVYSVQSQIGDRSDILNIQQNQGGRLPIFREQEENAPFLSQNRNPDRQDSQ